MPLTEYQLLVKKHLEHLLAQGFELTTDVVVLAEEREFISDICAANGYVAMFSYNGSNTWISFRASKLPGSC